MPAQQRIRRHERAPPQRPGEQPDQGGEHSAIRPVQLRPGVLPPQHRHLLAQHQQLGVLRHRRACQQRHPASQADKDQVDHPYRHEPAIMPAARPSPQANPQVNHLWPRFGTPHARPVVHRATAAQEDRIRLLEDPPHHRIKQGHGLAKDAHPVRPRGSAFVGPVRRSLRWRKMSVARGGRSWLMHPSSARPRGAAAAGRGAAWSTRSLGSPGGALAHGAGRPFGRAAR